MSITRCGADRLALRMLAQPDGRRLAVDLDEALRRQAVDREQLLARMRAEDARTRLRLRRTYRGFLRRWEWSVVDVTTGKTMASGRALTEWGMRRRRYAAYLLVLNRLAAERRAES